MRKLALDPLDPIIGRNIRRYRLLRGLSLEALAAQLGITYQQLQKYERGLNRVPASRLYRMAEFLSISVDAFKQDPDKVMGAVVGASGCDDAQADVGDKRRTLDVIS